MKHRSIPALGALLVILVLGACAPPNQGGQSSTGATPGAQSASPEPMESQSGSPQAEPTPYDY